MEYSIESDILVLTLIKQEKLTSLAGSNVILIRVIFLFR